MKPTFNRLLVRVEVVVPKEGETVKGNSVMTAEVLASGPDTKFIKKGNKVMFSPYGFDEVFIDGEKLVVIDENLILAYE
jgi:co-chaperonin GroES (HSP10)